MIKLATVFSGIGAIEHALQRMNLEHEIVFACDNGDVEILTKNIGMNVDAIGQELDILEKVIKTIQFSNEFEDLYKIQLSNMIDEAKKEFNNTIERIKSLPKPNGEVKDVLSKIVVMEGIKKREKKSMTSSWQN